MKDYENSDDIKITIKTAVCVPTYKRKNFALLDFIIKNSNVDFFLCVRKEEYLSGFYNHLFSISNIKFLLLENVHDIGETRQRIVELVPMSYDYLFMIDDTQKEIISENRTFIEIIKMMENRFETDELKDYAAMYTMAGKNTLKKYFGANLCGAFMINRKLCKKYNLQFNSNSDVGIEDIDFGRQCVMNGLIYLSGNVRRKGKAPCKMTEKGKIIEGGNHIEGLSADDKYRPLFKKFQKKVLSIDPKGVCLVKFYNFPKHEDNITFGAGIDLKLANILLIDNRDKSKSIIDKHLCKSKFTKDEEIYIKNCLLLR